MNFLAIYMIRDWRDKWHLITAKRLYERIMIESKYALGGFTSVYELVRICTKKNFPEKYATGIKRAILNCFEDPKALFKCISSSDYIAVQVCYNSLTDNTEEIINAKKNYLTGIIRKTPVPNAKYFFYHEYSKIREEWQMKKLEEFITKRDIDFIQLEINLTEDFNQTIMDAEKRGAFKEYDEN